VGTRIISYETQTQACATRRIRFWSALVLAAIAIAAVPLAGGGGRAKDCDHVCTAKRLLLALYPDLRGRNAQVRVAGESPLESEGSMAVFQASVSTPVPDKPGVGRSGPPEMIDQLWGIFMISSGPTQVLQVQCFGAEVIQEKDKKLTELVDSHPEWTEEQAIQALKEAGASFGPDAKELVQKNLPFERLEPIVGKIHLTSLYFEVRNSADPPQAMLSWYADFTAEKGGRKKRYYLAIEPFGGRPYILHSK